MPVRANQFRSVAGNVVETKMNVLICRHFRQIVEMPTSDAAFSFVFYESAALFEGFFKVFFRLSAVGDGWNESCLETRNGGIFVMKPKRE